MKQKRLVKNLLLSLGGIGLAAFALLMIWTAVTELIIVNGQIATGIAAILFVLGLVSAFLLILYRRFLIEATAKRPVPTAETPLPETANHQLLEPSFEPIPSVTESTTDLLPVESRIQKG